MKDKTLRVLVVEDNEDWQDIFQEVIEDKGHTVDVAGKFTEAVACLDANDYDLAVVDIRLEEDDTANANGLQLLPVIRAKKDYTRIVVATGFSADPDKLGKITQAFKQYNVLDSLDKTKRELLDEELGTILDRVSEAKLIISKGPLFVLARSDIHAELHKLLDDCTQFMGADLGQFLLCEETDALIVMVSTIENEEGFRVKGNESVSGKVIQEKKPIIIPDTREESLYKCCTEGMLSELAVPLMVEDKVIGVLNMESYRLNAFSPDDADRLINVFVKQSVMLIENARLNQQIEALRDIETRLLENDIPQQDLLRLILKNGLDLIDAEFGGIVLQKGDRLLVEVSTDKAQEGGSLSVDSVCGEVIREEKPVRLSDVSEYPHFKKIFSQDMKSELAVPLMIENKVEGVFNVESPKLDAFTEYDQNLLSALAKEAGIAIRMARSYERLKEAKRRERMAAIGELSGDIVHRMNSPLSAIRANVQLIQQQMGAKLAENQSLAKRLAEIHRIADDAIKMVQEMKANARRDFAVEPIDMRGIVRTALADVKIPNTVVLENRICELDSLPLVLANQQLSKVFFNLITNAVEAMPKGGKLTLDAKVVDDKWVEATVEDTGIGIPEEWREEIFNVLSVFSLKATDKGQGLGLWYSRAYVEACGGEFPLPESEPSHTKFTIRLAIHQS